MTRDRALQILRQHEADLRAKGVLHVRLFGSVARDEAGPDSDVDVMVDLDPSNLNALYRIGSIQQQLEAVLGSQVDLSMEAWLKTPVRLEAEREQVYAF